MEHNRENIKQNIEYLEYVLNNWTNWQTHHMKLTQALRDTLALVKDLLQEKSELAKDSEDWREIALGYQTMFEECYELNKRLRVQKSGGSEGNYGK